MSVKKAKAGMLSGSSATEWAASRSGGVLPASAAPAERGMFSTEELATLLVQPGPGAAAERSEALLRQQEVLCRFYG